MADPEKKKSIAQQLAEKKGWTKTPVGGAKPSTITPYKGREVRPPGLPYGESLPWQRETLVPDISGSSPGAPSRRKAVGAPGKVGTFTEDYIAAQQKIDSVRSELSDYLASGNYHISGDGQVIDYDQFDEEAQEWGRPDATGTGIYQNLLLLEQNLSSIVDAEERGLYSTGAASAGAYVNTEGDKAAEAERAYNDYIGRISDMSSMEAAKFSQGEAISGAFKSAQEGQIARKQAIKAGDLGGWAGYQGYRPPADRIDYNPYIDSVKGTIPQQAPQFSPINVPESGWRGGTAAPTGPTKMQSFLEAQQLNKLNLGPADMTMEERLQTMAAERFAQR